MICYILEKMFDLFFYSLKEFFRLVSHPGKAEITQLIEKHIKDLNNKLSIMNFYMAENSKYL